MIKDLILLKILNSFLMKAGVAVENEIIQNKSQLKNYTNELLENLEKRKVYSPFIYSIWGADLADLQILSKFDKKIWFLLCVIDIFSKYAWVILLKDKGMTITNASQQILDESSCKQNKIRVDKGCEFYKRSIKSWLEKNAIEMYPIHNKGKSVVAERFIRTLKKK